MASASNLNPGHLPPARRPSGDPRTGTVLVTGAAGFIGSHLCAALLDRGQPVVGIDNFDPYYDPALKRENVHLLESHPAAKLFRFHALDITDAPAMGTLFTAARPTSVIHLAARAGVRSSIEEPVNYAVTNVTGTAILLEEARRAHCDRFIFASSSSVYGNNSKVPFSENDDVSFPISPYAATKRAGELLAHTHFHLTGMPTACLRFFTVFGPRQRPGLAIGLFLDRIAKGQPIPVFGDGSSSRDYTYVEDTIRGILAAHDRIDRHGYRIWNLGGSNPVSLTEMIETVSSVVGRPAIIDRRPPQPGDVERTFADPARSSIELSYTPRLTLREGIQRQWNAVREGRVVRA